jgi:hypothetical protein
VGFTWALETAWEKDRRHYWRIKLCRVLNDLLSVFFGHSTFFAECFFSLGKDKFQSTFWRGKLILIKKFSTTKLYNSSRWIFFCFGHLFIWQSENKFVHT